MGNQQKNLAGDLHAYLALPAVGTPADTAAWTLLEAPNNIDVVGVAVIFDAAVTGDDTDNFTLAARNEGTDGTGTAAVTDTLTFATGTNATAHVPVDLTPATTDADRHLDAGEVLTLVRAVTGVGLAAPTGLAVVTYRNR